jgi:hypothetical protein
MKFEVIIAIVVGWIILRAISRAIKNNKANLQRGGQNSNNSGNLVQQIAAMVEAERTQAPQPDAGEAGHSKEGHSLEREVDEKSTRIIDPFLEATSMEAQRGHYDEEALTEEYTVTHDQGKTVSHHKHQLFDPTKDRKKAVHLRESTGGAGRAKGRTERKVKKVHPIAKALATPGGRRQAMVLSEILKRPEF